MENVPGWRQRKEGPRGGRSCWSIVSQRLGVRQAKQTRNRHTPIAGNNRIVRDRVPRRAATDNHPQIAQLLADDAGLTAFFSICENLRNLWIFVLSVARL